MDEWPDIISNDEDDTDEELERRIAVLEFELAALKAGRALGQLGKAFQSFTDNLRVLHDNAVLSEDLIDEPEN